MSCARQCFYDKLVFFHCIISKWFVLFNKCNYILCISENNNTICGRVLVLLFTLMWLVINEIVEGIGDIIVTVWQISGHGKNSRIFTFFQPFHFLNKSVTIFVSKRMVLLVRSAAILTFIALFYFAFANACEIYPNFFDTHIDYRDMCLLWIHPFHKLFFH